MRTLIIGATGFIGHELIKELAAAGHQPVAVSRNSNRAREILGEGIEIAEWNGTSASVLAEHLENIDGIINLAGENIASGRWTKKRKKLLTESRVSTSRLVIEAIKLAGKKPSVLIQGSATGIYGTQVDDPANEHHPVGEGFLADLTWQWEMSVQDKELGDDVRLVIIRTGLVLGKNGGLLEKMLLPFRLYSGTVLGSGRQWMPWIHLGDQVRAIRFLLENNNCSGPYNLTAPEPVQMKTFIATLGKLLRKPVWLQIPSVFLKAALGEMAEETVLSSQKIVPAKLNADGFLFRFSKLEDALSDLLPKKN